MMSTVDFLRGEQTNTTTRTAVFGSNVQCDNETAHVTKLDLRGPSEFNGVVFVCSWPLAGNVPGSFGNLTSLKSLLLMDNNLAGELPDILDILSGSNGSTLRVSGFELE
ncbi:hypothetical protein ACH5RR_017156 [Cinchona calisaya]|uniref:Uncharacterized protein n=1 Tax=Cinchona calisaya TaxID=153742 RepID=A0ABD2ZY21_9GENT